LKDSTVTIYEMPTSDDTPIWDVWLSSNYLPTVTAADELGILKSLEEAPAGYEELSERMGFDLRATKGTLRLLAALGFLRVHLGVFQVTDTARLYLLRDSAFYWGHMLGNRNPGVHERLMDVLQGKSPAGRPGADGRPETGNSEGSIVNWSSGQIDMERAHRVAAAMQSHSLPAAIALARNGDFAGVSRLLDVGGGSGCFAIAMAREHAEMQCSVMELPAMCRVAQEYIEAGEVSDRVDTVAVDMFRQEWPAGYDAHFFSNVWHDWDIATCAWLAQRSYDALPSGGRICLHEMLLNDDGAGPLTAVSFSMLMLLGTQGQQFTLPELKELLEGAGFVDVRAQHTYGYYSLVTATKL
jgi:acetylserotonin N-methyltransferase